jgi:hypothetical protein
VEMFVITTMQKSGGPGFTRQSTWHGTLTAGPAATRADTSQHVIEDVVPHQWRAATVLFHSAEPLRTSDAGSLSGPPQPTSPPPARTQDATPNPRRS